MGRNPGWRRTLDKGQRVSPSKGADGGRESGTATIRGVRSTTTKITLDIYNIKIRIKIVNGTTVTTITTGQNNH